MAATSNAMPSATRASTRTKSAIAAPPATTRTKGKVVPPSTTVADRREEHAATAKSQKQTTSRKPLANRANSVEVVADPSATRLKASTSHPKQSKRTPVDELDKEPIKAYLRLRPHVEKASLPVPCLVPLNDTTVNMIYPGHALDTPRYSRLQQSTASPNATYTFSHVFHHRVTQSDFFTKTTLPLVRDLLDGQNSLLFAYGVTNSGKTYTIEGGTEPDTAGILPRTLDVIFNSIEGLHSDGRYRPVRLYGLEAVSSTDTAPEIDIKLPTDEPAFAEILKEHTSMSPTSNADVDSTMLKLDRNYEYSVWLSYAEVYNEKVYDLLASVDGDDAHVAGNPGGRATANTQTQSSTPNSLLLSRKALTVKPSPVSDSADDSGYPGKYISGLRQFRVTSASEAKTLVKLGQLHRRVFGTLANSQSSRSHGIFTIKVIKGHRGDKDDVASLQISRLTLVDLAGSERNKHTQTSGDRLKEAGSINKSLMVLGQCMEVMRQNQRRLAQSLANAGRTDTRDVKRTLAVVPFRHSKLTEILMDFFTGDGKVVMIVNINPYDTGFDENSNVMKFSALAREVLLTVNHTHVAEVTYESTKTKAEGGKAGPFKPGFAPKVPKKTIRRVTIESTGPDRKVSEAHIEILEEDEEATNSVDNEDDDDDEPVDPLVDALFDEIDQLRKRLIETEMRAATIEAETREEVMEEMEERLRSVEELYFSRLTKEIELNEAKIDAKIDMLRQTGLIQPKAATSKSNEISGNAANLVLVPPSQPAPPPASVPTVLSNDPLDYEEEKTVDNVLLAGEVIDISDDDNPVNRSEPPSPLANKGKKTARDLSNRDTQVKPPSPVIHLSSNEAGVSPSEYGDGSLSSDEEAEDWLPVTSAKPRSTRLTRQSARAQKDSVESKEIGRSNLMQSQRGSNKARKLEKSMSSSTDEDESDAAVIPKKKARQVAEPESGALTLLEAESEPSKKRIRRLDNKAVVTEEQIEQVVEAMDQRVSRSDSGKNIRRMEKRSR